MNILSKLEAEIKSNLPEVLSLRSKFRLKEDNSYVSEGDLLLDRIVARFVDRNYESYQLISEESHKNEPVLPGEFTYAIVVDPIDGTENFVSGLREWGVGVSVFKNGVHDESMIALPELDEYVYSGFSPTKYKSRIHGLSSSLTRGHLMDLEPGFEYRIIGCCMYNMLQVIKGSFAVFSNPKGANSWDILPGLNIALENNLEVIVENKNYEGEFLQPTQKYRFQVRNI